MPSDGNGKTLLQDPIYDPDNLLDSLRDVLQLKNDAALAKVLEVAPPVLSKIRHRKLPVGASMLIRMHEVSALSIKDLRILMGDRRHKFRIGSQALKRSENGEIEDIGGGSDEGDLDG